MPRCPRLETLFPFLLWNAVFLRHDQRLQSLLPSVPFNRPRPLNRPLAVTDPPPLPPPLPNPPPPYLPDLCCLLLEPRVLYSACLHVCFFKRSPPDVWNWSRANAVPLSTLPANGLLGKPRARARPPLDEQLSFRLVPRPSPRSLKYFRIFLIWGFAMPIFRPPIAAAPALQLASKNPRRTLRRASARALPFNPILLSFFTSYLPVSFPFVPAPR